MKKILMIAALALGAISCSEEENFLSPDQIEKTNGHIKGKINGLTEEGNEINTSFNLTVSNNKFDVMNEGTTYNSNGQEVTFNSLNIARSISNFSDKNGIAAISLNFNNRENRGEYKISSLGFNYRNVSDADKEVVYYNFYNQNILYNLDELDTDYSYSSSSNRLDLSKLTTNDVAYKDNIFTAKIKGTIRLISLQREYDYRTREYVVNEEKEIVKYDIDLDIKSTIYDVIESSNNYPQFNY